MFLSKYEFSNVIKNTPLVAIDLCIVKGNELLLGKRINAPAKNFFFVPGGRILKSEPKEIALKRILKNELGLTFKDKKENCLKSLGCYEHFYDDNFFDNKTFGTHYVVLAYCLNYRFLKKINKSNKINEQHSSYIWIDIDNLENYSHLIHQYSLDYINNPKLKSFKNNL